METYILQHVAFEGPGKILEILKERGHRIHIIRLYEGDALPDVAEVDFAVLMGGPMSVLDESEYPYFVDEKEFCRKLTYLGRPMLGICLGAQMIANAHGAAIKKNEEKEIGWHPITHLNSGEVQTVFHWHGETFDLPEGATLLASSAACKNQAFKLGNSYGLQYHIETTPESMESIIQNCGAELVETGMFIQDVRDIRSKAARHMHAANRSLEHLIDQILS